MNEQEQKDFETHVISQVETLLYNQVKANKHLHDKFNRDIGERLEKTLPKLLLDATPTPNYWFSLLNSVVNGLFVGLAVYFALQFG